MGKKLLNLGLFLLGPISKAGDEVVESLQENGTIIFEQDMMLERPRIKDQSDNLDCRELIMVVVSR